MTATRAPMPDASTASHLVRLGAWASLAVLSALSAYYLYQHPIQLARGEEVASAEPQRQAQQQASATRETMVEIRRLSATVATLSADRDKLNARLSSIEQNLASITGSLARQNAAPANVPLAGSSTEPDMRTANQAGASSNTSTSTTTQAMQEAAQNAVGIDLGTAPNVEGLRALWRKEASTSTTLATLQPVVAVREKPGSAAVSLRLIAGPLADAAEAARLCAALTAGTPRPCETTSYEGQRLALDVPPPAPRKRPAPLRLPSAPKPQAGSPQILPR